MLKCIHRKKMRAKSLKGRMKDHFLPHVGNDYHPHVFHMKRVIGYSAFFVLIKIALIGYAVGLPFAAYTAPDILTAQANKILALTNDHRKMNGLTELVRADALDRSASARTLDMANKGYFSHNGPEGHTFAYFMKMTDGRYVTGGENLAEGFQTAEEIVDAWEKSPTHEANLIDPNFKESGVGISEGEYNGHPTIFVTEHFGVPLSVITNLTDTQSTKTVTKYQSNTLSEVAASPSLQELEKQTTSSTAVAGISESIKIENEPSISLTNAELIKSNPWHAYLFAKSWFSGTINVFSTAGWIYIGCFIFLAFALILSLSIEFRKHHPQAVLKAVGMITLLVVLWRW